MLKRKLWSMARNSELSLGKHSCTFLLGRETVSLSPVCAGKLQYKTISNMESM